MKRLIRTTRLTYWMSLSAMVAVASACAPDTERDDDEAETVAEAAARDESSTPQEMTAVARIVDIPAYEEHDLDRDGALSRDEFGAWVARGGVHASWVYEAEGDLDVGPVSRRLLANWDADRDSLVIESEWTAGVGAWFEPGDHGTFAEWDPDRSGALDADEVARALQDRSLFSQIDLDGNASVDDRELADWLFGVIDMSDDARLDPDEWEAAVERGWIG
jgi:hypothetical protein